MTWYFDPSDRTMDVYDHTGTQVATNVTVSSWGEYPEEIHDIMRTEIDKCLSGTLELGRATSILRDLATKDIQEGTP